MFLKAPAASEKPKTNRSQNGAFTNKPRPKIKKFVPVETGDAQDGSPVNASRLTGQKQKIKESVPDSKFAAWLRAKQVSRAMHVDMAKDYILEGMPYKGDSTFDAKAGIKDRGGEWRPNADKHKDCQDRAIRRGWWCAPDETTLLKLLRIPNDDRGRRQWTPLDMGATQISFIVSWLDDFNGNAPGTSVQEQDGQNAPESVSGELMPPKRSRTCAKWVDEGVASWIIEANAKWVSTWVPDTKCVVCGQDVRDQFMDCQCQSAAWERCSKCGEKYRIDFRTRKDVVRNANAWCKCGVPALG